MNNIFAKLRNLDAYPKINEDFYNRTLSGGLITVISSISMILLFISELRLYINSMTHTELVVDTSRGETLCINFDVTFPALPCSILSLDAMDISGEPHLDVKHNVIKNRIDANDTCWQITIAINFFSLRYFSPLQIEKPLQKHGDRLEHNETYCGSCMTYADCCNSCEEVREAYRKKGWGMSNPDEIDQVNKVAGNFHFAPGKSFQQANVHVHDVTAFQKDSFNISHKINKLSFGESFPGYTPTGMFQYFVKVVPTIYTDINNHTIQCNQFSVTKHFRHAIVGQPRSVPGVFFFYDLSPIKVTFTEQHVSFLHFLTNICAIVGGMFTVSGILDSFIYHGQKAIKKKMEIGKYS
ncbi:hypothetical protein MKX01_026860 [Papaver californicum]|nr:hypothetical protein MKX01_026860 [Papaver californicum]